MRIRSRSIAFTLVSALVASTAAGQVEPLVPASLEVPAGQAPFMTLHAEGTQQYVCAVAPGGFAWIFFGPQATLTDEAERQIATHYLSQNPDEGGAARPTWQHSGDTSAVWAAPVASSTDPAFVAPGAIPWLLLRVVGARPGPAGGATLATTSYIQRVDTAGGIAPPTGCRNASDIGRKALVPYTTAYVFYREAP